MLDCAFQFSFQNNRIRQQPDMQLVCQQKPKAAPRWAHLMSVAPIRQYRGPASATA